MRAFNRRAERRGDEQIRSCAPRAHFLSQPAGVVADRRQNLPKTRPTARPKWPAFDKGGRLRLLAQSGGHKSLHCLAKSLSLLSVDLSSPQSSSLGCEPAARGGAMIYLHWRARESDERANQPGKVEVEQRESSFCSNSPGKFSNRKRASK